jgi:transposase InsO family protein
MDWTTCWWLTTALTLILLGAAFAGQAWRPAGKQYRRRRRTAAATAFDVAIRPRAGRKPDWVRTTVVRLALASPGAGVRTVAARFNREHADRGMTIGKTFVGQILQQHKLQAVRARPQRPPAPCPILEVWALDITEHRLDPRRPQPIAGLLDHGSRAVLSLEALRDKSAITLLRLLLVAIERYGRPRILRTDNEAVFTSRLFSFGLRWLGIQHRRTQPHSPWQNGRIERLFGTIKPLLRRFAPGDLAELHSALRTLGRTYNHLRPHMALGGKTPAHAWREQASGRHRVSRRR